MNAVMKQKYLNQYKQTSVETGMENATPHKLISMLYDGVLDNIALARGAMERKDFMQKGENINKAVSIIGSLKANLDMEKGKEVSDNFEALYSYLNRKLLEASSKNDSKVLDEIVELVKELRESWSLMPDNFKKATKSQIDSIKKS